MNAKQTANQHEVQLELVFDSDCPNVDEARDVLKRALQSLSLPLNWQEWERSDQNCPDYAKEYGSPTILVNSKDVSPSAHNDSACCRVYPENTEFKGCPSLDNVIAAIKSV